MAGSRSEAISLLSPRVSRALYIFLPLFLPAKLTWKADCERLAMLVLDSHKMSIFVAVVAADGGLIYCATSGARLGYGGMCSLSVPSFRKIRFSRVQLSGPRRIFTFHPPTPYQDFHLLLAFSCACVVSDFDFEQRGFERDFERCASRAATDPSLPMPYQRCV